MESDPAPGTVGGGDGGGDGGGGEHRRRVGGCDVDTRYPRSIEGILRIVTLVSLH